MQKKAARSSPERLVGIELMRGFAAFGVIFIHSGLVVDHRTTPASEVLRDLFDFVVPFFLVTSFFFAIRGEATKSLDWHAWLHSRFLRLGVPYVFWSLLYCCLRLAKFYWGHQEKGVSQIFQDPWGLLLNGGGSVALYFLPLVFTGLLIIHALRHFLFRASYFALGIVLMLAAAINQVIQLTGNSFDLGTTRGFASLLPGLNEMPVAHLILALLAEAFRCLPLIMAAAFAVRLLPETPGNHTDLVFTLGAILYLTGIYAGFKTGGYCPTDLLWGVGVFLIGWSLSKFLKPNKLICMIGAFSFGVYLVHQVVLEIMQLVVLRWLPHDQSAVSVTVMLGLATLAYFISMIIVAAASRSEPWMGELFAVKS